MKHPSFSIIVPVYQVEKYIERCAVSLFSQTYDNIQFIFVNDGTKDRSVELLHALIDTEYPNLKNRIIVLDKSNEGLPSARKSGVECAAGDYILHVDSDDYIEKDAVEKIASAAEQTDADMIYFDLVKEYPDRTSRKKEREYDDSNKNTYILNILNGKSPGYLVTKCFKRSVYNSHPLYYAPSGVYEDIYSAIQLIYYSDSVFHLKECLYHYDRSNPEAYTAQQRGRRHWQFCANMLDLYGHFADDIKGTPMEVAAPSMLFRVAWYTYRHKFDFFTSCPGFAEFVAKAPLGTEYYIPVVLQLFLRSYIKRKFLK